MSRYLRFFGAFVVLTIVLGSGAPALAAGAAATPVATPAAITFWLVE